jgi:hypothetical protein
VSWLHSILFIRSNAKTMEASHCVQLMSELAPRADLIGQFLNGVDRRLRKVFLNPHIASGVGQMRTQRSTQAGKVPQARSNSSDTHEMKTPSGMGGPLMSESMG